MNKDWPDYKEWLMYTKLQDKINATRARLEMMIEMRDEHKKGYYRHIKKKKNGLK